MLSPSELSQWIDDLLRGEEKQWVHFMKTFHPLIYGTIQKILPMDEVEDSAQQVYLSLIEKDYSLLKKFPKDSYPAFLVFLQRVSRNIAMRSRTKLSKKETNTQSIGEELNSIPDSRFLLEVHFVSRMDWEELTKDIENLKTIYREVIEFKIRGYKTREISQMLDIPEKTVQTRLDRARDKLKKNRKIEGLL